MNSKTHWSLVAQKVQQRECLVVTSKMSQLEHNLYTVPTAPARHEVDKYNQFTCLQKLLKKCALNCTLKREITMPLQTAIITELLTRVHAKGEDTRIKKDTWETTVEVGLLVIYCLLGRIILTMIATCIQKYHDRHKRRPVLGNIGCNNSNGGWIGKVLNVTKLLGTPTRLLVLVCTYIMLHRKFASQQPPCLTRKLKCNSTVELLHIPQPLVNTYMRPPDVCTAIHTVPTYSQVQ